MNIELAINVINTWIEPMRRTMKGTLSQDFLNAAVVLKNNAIRYRWHDVRKDPDDLPECINLMVILEDPESGQKYYTNASDYEECKSRIKQLEDKYGIQGCEIRAWREIEMFEEAEE